MPKPEVELAERQYHKYAYLVQQYGTKLFSFQSLAFERDDVLQELRIKLYQAILTYHRSCLEFEETGRRKPIPLIYYLRSSLSSHITDLILKIKRTESVFMVNSSANGAVDKPKLDVGILDENTIHIDLSKKKAVINGIDLMMGLTGDEKAVWKLFLNGYSAKKIKNWCKNKPINADAVIKAQKARLEPYREMMRSQPIQTFYVKTYEDEQ